MAKFGSGLAAAGIAATILGCSVALAAPMSDADKAAMQKATADCKAQVKEQARLNEMSLLARRKAVQSCVKDALAKH